jgi:hypothetical protein
MPKNFSRKGQRSRSRSGSRSIKQKIYYMKGCSKTGKPLKGGCGGTCGLTGGLTGGLKGGSGFYKAPGPIPGPFIGNNWSASIKDWPGVNGIGSDSNYLAQNLYKSPDVQTMMKLGGSRKRKGGSRKQKGGASNLLNLGRDVAFNFKSAYNALNGYSAPTNPLPYKDQLQGSNLAAYRKFF